MPRWDGTQHTQVLRWHWPRVQSNKRQPAPLPNARSRQDKPLPAEGGRLTASAGVVCQHSCLEILFFFFLQKSLHATAQQRDLSSYHNGRCLCIFIFACVCVAVIFSLHPSVCQTKAESWESLWGWPPPNLDRQATDVSLWQKKPCLSARHEKQEKK